MLHLIQYRASRGCATAEQLYGNIADQASFQHRRCIQAKIPTHVFVNAGILEDVAIWAK
jgi:hypothetical protein